MRLLVCVLAACGGTPSVAIDAATGCTATLDGNVTEAITLPEVCPTSNDGALQFSIPSMVIGEPIGVQLAVGATEGMFSSETVTDWSGIAIRKVAPDGACIYRAGSDAVPRGSFTLSLGTQSTLDMTLAVLARTTDQGDQTDCGAGSTEHLHVEF
ncbi:MAG TPA: hypothetical protein VGC41_00275 [Kofleriaceae bacterium]